MNNALTATVGQKVICTGYPGTITEVCTGQLAGIVVVQFHSGTGSVCVAIEDLGKAQ